MLTNRFDVERQGYRSYLRVLGIAIVLVFVVASGVALLSGSAAKAAEGSTAKPGTPSQFPPPACGPGWNLVPNPTPTSVPYTDTDLKGLAAISPNDVWAVGSYFNQTDGEQTLIEHWNGTAWSIVPSPSTADNDTLYSASAVSSNDIWAVGNSHNFASDTDRTLTEHWDGTMWSIVPSPNLTSSTDLFSVSAVASNDVWAVGYYSHSYISQSLVEHWDGSTWSVVTESDAGSNYFFIGVGAVSSSDVWAVGSHVADTGLDQPLVKHWDGSTWNVVPSPIAPAEAIDLTSVAAVTPNDVWAVGSHSSPGGDNTLTEHWDGTRWSVVPSPNSGSNASVLDSIAIVSARDIWAVGSYTDMDMEFTGTLVEHWDGSAWSIVPSPNPSPYSEAVENSLAGVAAAAPGNLWAVGSYTDPTTHAITLQYDSCPVTPTPTSCPAQYSDVPPGSTYYPYIHCLACLGIINGYSDGTFRPNDNVTRGQLSKIISNAAGFNDPQTIQMFEDVPLSSTFQVFIGRLTSRGYISGYACGGPGDACVPPANLPYFRPNNNATRGQISKIVSNAADFTGSPPTQQFEDVSPASPYYTYTFRLYSRGIMAGYACGGPGDPCVPPANFPYFRPNNNATRGQTSKTVSRAFFPDCSTVPLP